MTEFKIEAKKILDELFSFIEKDFDNFDVDYEDENLVIQTLDEKRTFILSIHDPSSQIWLSSPITGAHHFEKDKSSLNWISTRDKNIILHKLLQSELKIAND
ncbi:MAG: frataxin domain-containing protein [Alphaproteobacteria bacterium]